MFRLIAVAALAMATPALASPITPPGRFDPEPAKPYRVLHVDADFMRLACPGHRVPKGQAIVGCTIYKSRTVLILDGLSARFERQVLRHEKAHLNGWRH